MRVRVRFLDEIIGSGTFGADSIGGGSVQSPIELDVRVPSGSSKILHFLILHVNQNQLVWWKVNFTQLVS